MNEDYIELKKQVEVNGLLKHTPYYYLLNLSANFLLLILCFVLVFNLDNWYATILMSVPVAFISIQFGYLGHDAGHNSISKNRRLNYFIGQFCHSFILGISFSYWEYRHNSHHANPNHEYLDPDIGDPTPLSFTETQAKKREGISRLITRYQPFILVPAFTILFSVIKLESIKYLFKNRKGAVDIMLMLAKVTFFLLIASYFVGVLKALVFYLLVNILTNFYFSFAFFPNHMGLPILKGDENLSFLEEQVITSRDIRGGKFFDVVFGGLNYQIEHHLFPNISRKNLSKIKAIVKPFCIKKSILYKDETLAHAWKEILIYLNKVGKHTNIRFSILRIIREAV